MAAPVDGEVIRKGPSKPTAMLLSITTTRNLFILKTEGVKGEKISKKPARLK